MFTTLLVMFKLLTGASASTVVASERIMLPLTGVG